MKASRMAESPLRIISFYDTGIIEYKSGRCLQRLTGSFQKSFLFINERLIDFSFIDQILSHIDFILINLNGSRRIC